MRETTKSRYYITETDVEVNSIPTPVMTTVVHSGVEDDSVPEPDDDSRNVFLRIMFGPVSYEQLLLAVLETFISDVRGNGTAGFPSEGNKFDCLHMITAAQGFQGFHGASFRLSSLSYYIFFKLVKHCVGCTNSQDVLTTSQTGRTTLDDM